MSSVSKDYKLKTPWFSKPPGTDAILSGVLSIDGNHQWRQPTPPYLRKEGIHDADKELPYAEKNSINRLFSLVPAKRPNTEALFSGPLIPSFETPAVGGFKDVRPKQNKYVPSESNLYPDF